MIPGVVLDQIDKSIEEARVIVADLTGKNPNVMQEVGYARALRKPIVFISQDPHRELPFDTRHYRTQLYQMGDGLAALRSWLRSSLVAVLEEPYAGVPDSRPMKLSLDYVQKEIQPPLEAEGYELIYPLIQRADECKLKGWDDIRWKDAVGQLRPIHTEEHAPLMRRSPLRTALARYSTDLRSIEAEWRAERGTTPRHIDDGKAILQKAERTLLSLRGQEGVPDSGQVRATLDEIQRDLKQIQGHRLNVLDAGSEMAFWQTGDELFSRLSSVPAVVQQGGRR